MDGKIQELLAGKSSNHILPFFWQHGEEEPVLREYIQVINEAGCGAVCVESRPHPDFCGPGWWRDMDIILDEARKRNMKVWILDDSHFPTGYANGALKNKPDTLCRQSLYRQYAELGGHARTVKLFMAKLSKPRKVKKGLIAKYHSLTKKNLRIFNDDRILCVTATSESGQIINLTEQAQGKTLVWEKPEGNWTVTLCGLTRNLGPHRDYINMMDPDSCKVLIDAVYEAHWERYKNEFGKTIAGFFSDEPELGNATLYLSGNTLGTEQDLPWSAPLEEKMAITFGTDWTLELPRLWQTGPAASVRTRYMDLVTSLVQESFSESLGIWCREHGVEYIGHVVEDNGQHCRTGSSLGHYFRGLSGQDMAGIDDIGGQVLPQGEDEPVKGLRDGTFFHYGLGSLAASAAAIEPRKKGRAMCEIFGNYGWGCGVQLQKYLIDHFMAQGINYFVPHAFSQKKYPDVDCPPHFYARGNNPQIRHFGKLMQYANRICECISGGRCVTDIAVLYHAESEWAGDAMPFERPLRMLWDRQINCTVLPADVFAFPEDYGTEITNPLVVNNHSFKAMVIPKAEYIPDAVACAVKHLLDKGFPVYFVEQLPKGICETGKAILKWMLDCPVVPLGALADQCAKYAELSLVPSDNRVRVLHYEADTPRYFIINEAAETYSGTLTVPSKGPCYLYNAWGNMLEPIHYKVHDNGTKIGFSLEPRHSLLVVFDDAENIRIPVAAKEAKRTLLPNWKRKICRALEYPAFSPGKNIQLPDLLSKEKPKFSGFVRYETSFVAEEGRMYSLEIENAAEGVEFFVNGQSLGIQIVPPYIFDMDTYVQDGQNALAIEVATSLEREAYKKLRGIWRVITPKPSANSGITGAVTLVEKTFET